MTDKLTENRRHTMGKIDVEALHDAYCAGYHNLPRTAKRHLSLHDMQEIWFHMVRPVVDTLAAENEAAWKSANMWEAEVGAYLRECADLTAELETLKWNARSLGAMERNQCCSRCHTGGKHR